MSATTGRNTYLVKPYYILNYDSRKKDGTLPLLKIGKFCSIAINCTFIMSHHNYKWVTTTPAGQMKWPHKAGNNSSFCRGDIIIGNDVWIGANCTILDNLTIGNGAVLAAGSVVTKSVAPYSIVGGNPAIVIDYRFNTAQINALERIKWWDLSDSQLASLEPLLFSDNIDGFIKAFRIFPPA